MILSTSIPMNAIKVEATVTTAKVQYDYLTLNGLQYKLNIDNKTASVYGKSGRADVSYKIVVPSANLVIPEVVESNGQKYSVTSISLAGFDECTNLASITVPSSVTCIGNSIKDRCDFVNDHVVGGMFNNEYTSADGVVFTREISQTTDNQGSTDNQGATDNQSPNTTQKDQDPSESYNNSGDPTKAGDVSAVPLVASLIVGAIGMAKLKKKRK